MSQGHFSAPGTMDALPRDCPPIAPPETLEKMMSDQKPTIGRIVHYRSKIDNGPGNDVISPAVIVRTKDYCVEAVAKRWGGTEPQVVVSASDPSVTHLTSVRPEGVADMLPDDDTIDLLVHGLGKDYREYSVTKGDGHGQWFWPPRV